MTILELWNSEGFENSRGLLVEAAKEGETALSEAALIPEVAGKLEHLSEQGLEELRILIVDEAGKPAETRAEIFSRLANKRLPATVKQIRLLKNLSAYDYTEAQADLMVSTLQEEVEDLRVELLEKSGGKPIPVI